MQHGVLHLEPQDVTDVQQQNRFGSLVAYDNRVGSVAGGGVFDNGVDLSVQGL